MEILLNSGHGSWLADDLYETFMRSVGVDVVVVGVGVGVGMGVGVDDKSF